MLCMLIIPKAYRYLQVPSVPLCRIPANCDQHTPIHFSNGYHESPPNVTYQQTINPQFLTAPQHPSSQPHVASHNDFLVVNPADFERPETAK